MVTHRLLEHAGHVSNINHDLEDRCFYSTERLLSSTKKHRSSTSAVDHGADLLFTRKESSQLEY